MYNKGSKSVIKTQRKKKLFALNYFGNKCSICGYNKCPGALEFHHIDPKNKKHEPSQIIMRWSWDKVLKELEKCLLVCSNCHAEIHYKELDTTDLRKTKEILKKDCYYCKIPFTTKEIKQKFCSKNCAHVFNRKVIKTPNKEDIIEARNKKMTWNKIGAVYNVSGNSIRKWAKKFKIL